MNMHWHIANAGGAMRTADLRKHGFSEHAIRRALAKGAISRPRKGIVALPHLDPAPSRAAQLGVSVGCVSAALELGLWALQPQLLHLSAKHGRHVQAAHTRVHRNAPLVPRRTVQLVDHVENVLDTVSTCLPHDEALAIWDSALQKGLVDLPQLETLPFGPAARSLLTECTPYSDSGLESMFRTRLRWLNAPIRPQAWLFGHRVDFLIGDRLVIQIDGKQHEGAQRTSDRAHDAALMERGYFVLRIGYAQIVHDWPAVEQLIMRLLARGVHRAR